MTGRGDCIRRWVTIVFTDIEGSTRHWHELGDVEGRRVVERHDALLLPVVGRFGGVVVKTIGDSIMARFDQAENAVAAAVAMQHAMDEAREKDPDFDLRIRIGIHRGRAIVEQHDVYGDSVNVAARVEGEARGGEVLISGAVVQALEQGAFPLTRRESFVPRGKSTSVLLYRVGWWKMEPSELEGWSRAQRSGGSTGSARRGVARTAIALCALAGLTALCAALSGPLATHAPALELVQGLWPVLAE